MKDGLTNRTRNYNKNKIDGKDDTKKKKLLSIIFLALMGISLVACGNGENGEKENVAALKNYSDIPFSIFIGEGEDVQTLISGTFPDSWKGTNFDSISYYEYFRKNYGLGSMEVPTVSEGTKLTMDFGGYQPDKITVQRDPNTFAVLSAKESPDAEKISEVALKDNCFTVEYGEDSLLYYVITCEWEGTGTVKYGVIVSK